MEQHVRTGNSLGTAALVLGIIACLGCWIPLLCIFSMPIAVLGLLFAILGFFMAIFSRASFSSPIGGGIVCTVALFISTSLSVGPVLIVGEAIREATSNATDENATEFDSSETTQTTEAEESGSDSNTAEESQKTSKPGKEETKGLTFTPITFRKKVSLENAEFRLNSIKWNDEIMPPNQNGFFRYLQDVTGEKYIIIQGTFKNKTNEPRTLSRIPVQFIFDGKYKYEGSLKTLDNDGKGFNSFYETKPLKMEKIIIYASVPDDLAKSWKKGVLQFGFHDDLSSSRGDNLEKMENRFELKLKKP